MTRRCIPKQPPKVIDVSYVQTSVDWNKVKKAGIAGAIIKCGGRGAGTAKLFEDDMYAKHMKGAHDAGLPIGIYMFTEAINAAEGKAEAEYAISLWKKFGYPLSFPIAVDTENVFWYETKNGKKVKCSGRANSGVLSKAKRTEAIKAFCEEVKRQGYEPMIYASLTWFKDELDMSKLPYKVWVAQYNSTCDYKGSYVMWQYSSDGNVDGIKGKVDMNYLYEETKPFEPPKNTNKYTGELPTLRLQKTKAEVIADAVKWAVIIAGNNDFHYGHGKAAHANGCYFCKTEAKHKKDKGIVDYEHTYCCNPFVGAAWAHGGCVPEALKMCQKCDSYDFHKGKGYDKSKLFDNLGKLSKGKLKKGDVLCRDNHVMLYIGDGKVVHAHGGDDNVKGSSSWKNSINVENLGDKKYQRVHRFNSNVDAVLNIYHGEISHRVVLLQRFLIWYGLLPEGADDGIFFGDTFDALKAYQRAVGLVDDGVAGKDTLASMSNAER